MWPCLCVPLSAALFCFVVLVINAGQLFSSLTVLSLTFACDILKVVL